MAANNDKPGRSGASGFSKIAEARANIWLTTMAILGIILVIMVLIISPFNGTQTLAATFFSFGRISQSPLTSRTSNLATTVDPSLDFRTDVQSIGSSEWSESICPLERTSSVPKGVRPNPRPKVRVELDGQDPSNLRVGQTVKFKVFYYDCFWQIGNTFANWRDNGVYLDGFTMTPYGNGGIAVPENYYEQEGPYLRPGPRSWWGAEHVFSKPGTYPIRFRVRNASGTDGGGGSTIVTFPVNIQGSGQSIACSDSQSVKASLDSSSPSQPVFAAASSQQDIEVGRFKLEGVRGQGPVNVLYVAVEGKDGAHSGIDLASMEAGVFSQITVTSSSGQKLGAVVQPPLRYTDPGAFNPDFDRFFREGIVQWGGVVNASLGVNKQVWLYPIRLTTPLVVGEGQNLVIGILAMKYARIAQSLNADGWRFGIARVECGFGLNMIDGGSKYSTTAFTPWATTPGFKKTCSYYPPRPYSFTGGTYVKDETTCTWKFLGSETTGNQSGTGVQRFNNQ